MTFFSFHCICADGWNTHTHTHPFNGPLSGTTQVSRYQKGKTNLDSTEARDSEWQWHPLGCMQVCTLLQSDNHASTPPLNFLQAGCPSCRPTNSVKALKVDGWNNITEINACKYLLLASFISFYICIWYKIHVLPKTFISYNILFYCNVSGCSWVLAVK